MTDKQLYADYISAEVTLFWTANSETGENRLIFAVTELISENQLPSAPLGGGASKYLSKKVRTAPEIRVMCRRFFCSVEQAVKCFKEADWASMRDGPGKMETGSVMKREPSDGFSIVLPRGHVALVHETPNLSMALPNRSTSFRAYAYLENDDALRTNFGASKRAASNKDQRR